MVKKLLVCFIFLLVIVSSAWSETSLRIEYRILADIIDGHSDYSDARFGVLRVRVRDDDPADEMTAGSLTLSGGNYLYYDGDDLRRVSGTQQTFTLRPRDDRKYYLLRNKEGSEIRLALEDENGLEGVTASWNFPDRHSMNGETVITRFKTVQEQLNSFVPYFEYILDGSKVTGIRWRIVNPSDTSKPVSQDFYMGFNFWDGRYGLENYVSVADDWVDIAPGTTPEGVFMFEEAVEVSEMAEIDLQLHNWESYEEKLYQWRFYTPRETEPNLWSSYRATASLINGKSDYRNAKFHSIGIFPQVNNVIGELKCFTNTGQFTVPGGDYTIIARNGASTPTILETVAAGTDRTFGLIPDEESAIGSNYTFTYRLVHSSGEDFTFGGNAEHNLAGKTFTWTFPSELSYLNGSGTVPNYKSVSEQLRTGVPYIELVSADGYVTALNYKIVTSSDTLTAITPSYRTDCTFYVETDTETITGSINNAASGTYTLNTPVAYEELRRIIASLRSYTDADSYLPHTWVFYKASADDEPEIASISITTTTLTSGTTGTPYTAQLASSPSGATWAVSSGTLPAGLSLSTSGAITGTPTTAGTYSFTIRAALGTETAARNFTITIAAPTLTITTSTLSGGTVGTTYSATITSNSTNTVTWSVYSGALPDGLSLDSANGKISGTPSKAGTFAFTVQARDPYASATKSLSITITAINDPGSSSGGCSAGISVLGLGLIALLLKRKA